MAVLADELEHDARLGAEAHADLQLMREQIAYCKRIITRLTEQAGAGRTEQMEPIACDTWFHHLYEDWRALRGFPQSELCINLSAAPAPRIIAEPTLGQGLVNLLDNALRAGAPVLMSVEWTSQEVRIEIRDQGQGFSPEALNQAGRLPFAAGPEGSGIGLILTRSAIERLGGQLRLSNLADGGALAQVVLPLARIAAHG
jgi:two-component system sensor histidine kinase RegB